MKKPNCWEVKKCGREVGGVNSRLGICPTALETRLHGIHDGINAGRACWVVAGTMCEGRVEGTFANKYETCEQCDFYNQVKKDAGAQFYLSLFLLKRLKEK